MTEPTTQAGRALLARFRIDENAEHEMILQQRLVQGELRRQIGAIEAEAVRIGIVEAGGATFTTRKEVIDNWLASPDAERCPDCGLTAVEIGRTHINAQRGGTDHITQAVTDWLASPDAERRLAAARDRGYEDGYQDGYDAALRENPDAE